MFASLEARSPLLDRDLARLAATLRPEQLLRMDQPKAILKALALRHLPASLVLQEKRGFGVPIADWLRGDLKTEFRNTVLGGRQELLPMDYSYVEELLEAHQRGADYSHRLWALYAFHVWAQDVALASLGAR
jgi:asparagine synthase (glutamine-hydrolysing)